MILMFFFSLVMAGRLEEWFVWGLCPSTWDKAVLASRNWAPDASETR